MKLLDVCSLACLVLAACQPGIELREAPTGSEGGPRQPATLDFLRPDVTPPVAVYGYQLGTSGACSAQEPQAFREPLRPGEIALHPEPGRGPGEVAHAEPPPPSLWAMSSKGGARSAGLVMPGYTDDMPLFERAQPWSGERCFAMPGQDRLLDEEEAYLLYRRIAELTTGVPVDDTPDVRTVLGVRGAYPGTFTPNGDAPNRFNDTLVLIWRDAQGAAHVLEFPVNTGTGAVDFGFESSSSLRPNRRYRYSNGWHRGYNALRIEEYGYRVLDDTNHNGHADSDRDGWLPPLSEADYERGGSGHNIHAASVDAPLGSAGVNTWSAGCQTIPGMVNWTTFIEAAWTGLGDDVSYFLVDVRDIPAEVWAPCTPDGSHDCPWSLDTLPYTGTGNTLFSQESSFDVYSCSPADESGPEDVYVLTLDRSGRLTAEVDCDDPTVDVDVHLLRADDPLACVDRGHWEASAQVGPGRWYVVVDTWVDDGEELAGAYSLTVTLD